LPMACGGLGFLNNANDSVMNQPNVPRRLAAILAADVVGYSRLTGIDEEGTLARLRGLRYELIDPAISRHRGRIVKTTGDGILVEFASAVDAVRCALDVQWGMVGWNATLPAEKRIEFRVGINVGDVVVEGDDLLGDAVNIAARLEGISETGGICVSDDAFRHVQGKVDAKFTDQGEQSLKNIARPVRVYRIDIEKDGRPSAMATTLSEPAKPALALPDKPSIAVLPFTNMSGDPEQDYFCDGMVEDIITGLSRIRWLFVIARNSSFVYKGNAVDVKQVGRELGVRYVLEGSVRKVSNRVRITGQLLEAETGSHVWAERYDRALDDIFVMQDEITSSVVGCIEPQLYAAEHARLNRKPPRSLDAWECFIRAMFLQSQHSEEGSHSALELLDRAVELDRAYGQAHGLKAFILIWRVFQGWSDMGSVAESAAAAATRAIACDSQDPWAYIGRGMVAVATRDASEAINAFRHSTDLSPNFAYAHALLGATLALGGRPEEGIASVNRAVRLSPRDTFSDDFQLYYAFAHFQAGRYVEAVSYAKRAIQLRPEHPGSHIMATASYGLAGEEKNAVEALAQLRALVPTVSIANVEKTFPYVLAEDRTRVALGLRRAGLPE
jgi:adenylate cyclase